MTPAETIAYFKAQGATRNGVCGSLADLHGGPDHSDADACTARIDPESLLALCVGHDRLVQATMPHAYQAWTGREAAR